MNADREVKVVTETTHWGVAIDTDAYAGCFERQMCAHITGQVGDCNVGEDFISESLFEDSRICHIPDEHGCSRPCAITITPGGPYNNSVVIFFETEPDDNEIAIIKERAGSFIATWNGKYVGDPYMWIKMTEVIGFRVLKYETVVTERVVGELLVDL